MAHWIISNKGFWGNTYTCSECGFACNDMYCNIGPSSDCPNCGGDMYAMDATYPISPETFASCMREVRDQYEDDRECRHIEMDYLMCKLLADLGYGEGVKIFEDTGKWYA